MPRCESNPWRQLVGRSLLCGSGTPFFYLPLFTKESLLPHFFILSTSLPKKIQQLSPRKIRVKQPGLTTEASAKPRQC